MMRSLQIESLHRRHTTWMWCMVLLCISVLFFASTAQACHAHGALLPSQKAQISAPVDECPLCAAPHAALVAEGQISVAGTLHAEDVLPAQTVRPFRALCAFDLFSRPPPACEDES